jgi:hypothetical protein
MPRARTLQELRALTGGQVRGEVEQPPDFAPLLEAKETQADRTHPGVLIIRRRPMAYR